MDETVDAGLDGAGGAASETGVDSSSSAGGNKDNTDWKSLYEKANTEKESQRV